VCPNRDWFSNSEKLDDCSVVMGDDRPCNIEGIGTVLIKMFDGMVRDLKKIRYVPQLKKNLISIGVLETLSPEISSRNGVLKMLRGSMVVMKGVRCNNLYCLKGTTVTRQVATSISSDDDFTRL